MKLLILVIVMGNIVACKSAPDRNQIMTDFLNQKKITEDSISLASNYEHYYYQKAKESIHAGEDSVKWKLLIDSSSFYSYRGSILKRRLTALDFSVDSLSKMK